MTVNQIIGYFANASIKFINAFIAGLDSSKIDTGRKTAKGVCGLVIPLKGNCTFSLNGTEYDMNCKTILHAGSSMDLTIKSSTSRWEYAVVHYQVIHVPEQSKELMNQHFQIIINDQLAINEQVHYLLKHQAQPDYMSKLQVQNVFMSLIEKILLSARNGRFENKKDTILSALEYMQVHYAQDLSIGEIAQRFGVKRRRFSYLFEQLTGLTPIEYLTQYRVSHAKEFLRNSDISIGKIAEMVGYEDSFYFSRVFKKQTGISPSMYRIQHEISPYYSI